MTKDEVYLKHILDAISDIKQFLTGLSQEEFFQNKEKQYAVLRALEIIGEATKNLSIETKTNYSKVNWKKIAGMRDKLIHAYSLVDLPLVWDTIQIDIPLLEKQAKEILESYQ
jgi:uncharacterized protein with HEPN domain